jgi:murein DD-endopeptidase MepM/ murein hydrolase activator NlpD
LLPADLTRYTIFGDSIFSPCTGQVVATVDGVHEMTPPRMDRAHMAGNHVLIKCRDVWILLGHMKRGSVAVGREQQVATGDLLGRVGNTGNTNEPHLHIHAQTPGTASEPLSGNPLPIVFDGRFVVRNDLIRAPSE